MSEVKILTKEIIIQEIPKFDDAVDLSQYTQIDDDAAESLSKCKHLTAERLGGFCGADLCLDGLTQLSDAAAESLSKHGDVCLPDELEEQVAKYR